MNPGRTILSSILAISLASCGGGGGGTSTPPRSGDGGGGTANCSLSARQDWALGVLREWYLFPDLLDTSVNKASYDDLQSYIDAVTAPGEALFDPDNIGKQFTYITSIEEENDLIQNGSSAGFGFRLTYDTVNNRVFVAEVFETAPAFPAFDRGTEILAIEGQSIDTVMAQGGPFAVIDLLGASTPGLTRSFQIRSRSGEVSNVTISKAEYSLDPVSDRYGAKILNDGAGGQVGYINLRTFIVQNASNQLRDAFQQFKNAGIDRVILDLRYNGGGLVNVAETLGDLLGEGLEGEVFSRTQYRPSKAAENSTRLFQNETAQIDTMKLAVIGRLGTASASELVANSMIPYLGDNIALIGTDTYGKPVGQDAFDRSACDDRLRAVTFQTVNANNQGEYYGGLASVMPNTCVAPDDIRYQLGDPREASVDTAIDFLAGRTCQPITTIKDTTAQASRPGLQLFQPRRPNAAQHDIPGLF